MKKITEITKDEITVKVFYSAEWEEFCCKLFVDGLHQGEKTDYNTDDKEDAIQTAEAMLKNAEGKDHLHTMKTGDIVYNSWGYDQTNVDFYQVVKTTKCFVSLRPIAKMECIKSPRDMSGHVVARKDHFTSDEITRHKGYFWNGENHFRCEYGAGCKWDGQPKYVSSYA